MQKVRYVQRVKHPDGTLRLYFRKGSFREGPLASPDCSEALREEVGTILRRIAAAEGTRTPKANTAGAMLAVYAGLDDRRDRPGNAEFLSLARSTQKEYARIARELRDDIGDVLLGEVTPAFLRDLRDGWAKRGYKAANDRRQVLCNALKPAIEDERVPADPFAKVGKVARPGDAGESHPTWEDAEVEAAIALSIARGLPGLARAIGLGRFGGFRRGTICALPLNARATGYDAQGMAHPRLVWITQKRKVLADKREDPRLTALIGATPNRALTIAYNDRSEPWKARALNQAIERLVTALAKRGEARDVLTIHGLRHARGVELALAGASDAEIMSQLEHATDRAAKIYRRQADRRKLADAGQDRVDSVVELRAARARTAAERKL
jgi:hypothetical protein